MPKFLTYVVSVYGNLMTGFALAFSAPAIYQMKKDMDITLAQSSLVGEKAIFMCSMPNALKRKIVFLIWVIENTDLEHYGSAIKIWG